MKINDLLEYYEAEFTPPKHLPEINDHSTSVGKLSCKIGLLDVYKNDDPGYKEYIVVDKNKKTLAFLHLMHIHQNYAQVKNVYCTLPNEGIITGLHVMLVRQEHIKLLSDYQMTKDGAGLWDSIIRKNLLNVSVIDLNKGKQYSLEDAAKQNIKTDDGDIVTLPNYDRRDKPEHGKMENTQRFVYIAESKHKPKNIKDTEVSEQWAPFLKALLENKNDVPCYSYQFGPGEP